MASPMTRSVTFARKRHPDPPPCCSVVLRGLRVKCLILSNGASWRAKRQVRAQSASEPIRSCANSDGGFYPEDDLRNQRRRALAQES
jgi:hypothetical protein